MSKRTVIAAVCCLAVVALLSIGSYAFAVSGANDGVSSGNAVSAGARATATPCTAGWILQARGTLWKDISNRTYRGMVKARPAEFVDQMGTPDDATDDQTYKGVALWRLVALVDDKDPKTFSKALAAKGWEVDVVALDGFFATFKLSDIRGKNDIVLANTVDGQPFPYGSLSEKGGVWSWKGTWPLRIVGSNAIVASSGKMRPAAVYKILVHKPSPSPSPSPSP